MQLLVSSAAALALVLVSLSLVGPLAASLPALSLGAWMLRAGVGVAVLVLVGQLLIHVVPAVPAGLAAPEGLADIRALGRGLFGHDMIVVAAAGFILLVAILGSVALVARSSE
jgi:NADH:ubiquinone oxidoreductase subunit 6 (subunit J)